MQRVPSYLRFLPSLPFRPPPSEWREGRREERGRENSEKKSQNQHECPKRGYVRTLAAAALLLRSHLALDASAASLFAEAASLLLENRALGAAAGLARVLAALLPRLARVLAAFLAVLAVHERVSQDNLAWQVGGQQWAQSSAI